MIRRGLTGTAVELAAGVLLMLTVVAVIVLWAPSPAESTPQLDRYAADTADLLIREPTRGTPGTRSGAVLDARADALLPTHVEYRVVGPAGAAGPRPPPTAATGTAIRPTPHGELRVIVWYG